MATLGATDSTTNFLGYLTNTATWDPGSLTNGSSELFDITVTGAALGDPVLAGLSSINAAGWRITANVRAADTVSVMLTNNTGGTVNLASGTLRAIVFKP